MKNVILALSLLLLPALSHAEETAAEKHEAATNTVGRKATKVGHRLKEAVCMKGDVKCAAEAAKDHLKEGAETVKDKAKETKNKVD